MLRRRSFSSMSIVTNGSSSSSSLSPASSTVMPDVFGSDDDRFVGDARSLGATWMPTSLAIALKRITFALSSNPVP